ncbi:MAG: ABC transporter ATP-binding protein, partial [Snodgrassella sp.]|nr:ABC transporter ATP-binding protein [Snodgrassella sp.]
GVFLAHGEIIFSGSPHAMSKLDSPWVNQFIHGLADGPVAFRYPATTTLQQDLDIA